MLTGFLIRSYPFLLGTWLLRSTNDQALSNGLTYLIINNDQTIKLRTLNQEGLFGIKKSRSGIIYNITNIDDSNYILKIKYSHLNKYSNSFLGIEIPEFKSENKLYNFERNLKISILDKSLLINDKNSPLYYLFDLNVGNIIKPNIETGLNTFIFTQFISFFLNLLLAKILHNIFIDF